MLTTIFIHIYFRIHHFIVKFSKFSSPQEARGHCPQPKILRIPLAAAAVTKHLAESFGITAARNFTGPLSNQASSS